MAADLCQKADGLETPGDSTGLVKLSQKPAQKLTYVPLRPENYGKIHQMYLDIW
jgi:hypothetical protein